MELETKEYGRNYLYWCEALTFELFATALYMLAFNLQTETIYTAFGLLIAALLSYKVSGAHLNPALTLSVFVERKKYG